MNITTGTGASSWNPKRLSARAYSVWPQASPAESLPGPSKAINVITAQLNYGPVGACRPGEANLNALPAGWDSALGARLVQLDVEDETGTGVAYSGLLDQAAHTPGELSRAPLIAVSDKFAQATVIANGGSPFTWSPLVTQQRSFGVALAPTPADLYLTRQTLWDRVLEPYPNSEFGVGPDLVAVAGRPENATPALLDLGNLPPGVRPLNFKSLGFSIPDYLTEYVFDPGDGWDKTYVQRANVPAFVPERMGTATANPATVTQAYRFNLGEGYRRPASDYSWPFVTADDRVHADDTAIQYNESRTITTGNPVKAVGVYQYTAGGDSGSSKTRSLKFALSWRLNDVSDSGQPSSNTTDPMLVMTLERVGFGQLASATTTLNTAAKNLELNATLEVPADQLTTFGIYLIRFLIDTWYTGKNLNLTIHPIASLSDEERPNTAGIVIPRGFSAPFFVGPTYEFSLPGWHVPPFRIVIPKALTGLGADLTQYAASTQVTWQSENASTKFLTAALPYPGQRRA